MGPDPLPIFHSERAGAVVSDRAWVRTLISLQSMAQMRWTAVYMKVPEGYIAFVEELPGANTQAEALEEARSNLEEAVAMVLDANRELSEKSL